MNAKVLIAGESWMTTSTHVKGVDSFTVHSYVEGVGPLKTALASRGHEITHLPAHRVPAEFPGTPAELESYDLLILSDIGANSLQLSPAVFERAQQGTDRLVAIRDWVFAGGALLMIGGYLSFSGFESKAAFRQTALADVLPVEILPEDDRVEMPGGTLTTVVDSDHAALGGVSGEWPALLGYNRVIAKDLANVLAVTNGDPLIAVAEFGRGRSAAFTSDCSPHWAPPAFCEEWPGYVDLFDGITRWATRGT